MPTIIDVREPEEFNDGHVEGSLNIPLSKILEDLKSLPFDKNEELVLYCNSGRRSQLAINTLQKNGYKNLVNGINQQTILSKKS